MLATPPVADVVIVTITLSQVLSGMLEKQR